MGTFVCIVLQNLSHGGQGLEDKTEVIKHSAAIHIENKVSLLQRRAWNILLAHAYDELPHKEVYSVRVKELIDKLGYDSKDENHLKAALKTLATCAVEWDTLDKDGSPDWGVTTLLAQARIRNGTCSYAYSPVLRERLHNPKVYARISLSLQNEFTSKHALALYELFVDYLDEARKYGETPFILLAHFRKLMGIPDNSYAEFKKLNTRVIKEPIEEINERTDLNVTVEYQRKNRKVAALKFKIRRLSLLETHDPVQPELFPNQEDMPEVVRELVNTGLGSQDAWEVWQQGFGYVDATKRPKDIEFGPYIREKIDLLKRRQAGGKVGSVTGFLLAAIRGNYANPEFVRMNEKEQQTKRSRREVQQARREEQLQQQFDDFRTRRFWENFRARPDAWQEEKKQAFLDKIKGAAEHRFVWESYQRNRSLESPSVAVAFMQDLESELLTAAEEMSLEAFSRALPNVSRI